MKIAVYGGTGMVGSAIVSEAVSRGHDVTVITRHEATVEGASTRIGDLANTSDYLEVAKSNDAVVISIPPSRTGEDHTATLDTHKDIIESRPAGLTFVVGGAGSLEVDGVRLHETEGFPEMFKPEAQTMSTVLDMYRQSTGFEWTMVSPAPMIGPGERTGKFTVGTDSPVGDSISTQDFAIAVVDELENPAHRNSRFTVAS